MNGVGVVVAAVAALGIKWGWQPVAGGGIEYIIQIEPGTFDSLKSGQDLYSDLPPSIAQIRSYRITVGTNPLPHEGEPPPSRQPDAAPPQTAETPAKLLDLPPPPLLNLPPPPAISPSAAEPSPPTPQQDPLVHQAGGMNVGLPTEKPHMVEKTPTEPVAHDTQTAEQEPKKQWWPLTFSLLGLFASFGLNLYLGLIAWDLRGRYQAVVAQFKREK